MQKIETMLIDFWKIRKVFLIFCPSFHMHNIISAAFIVSIFRMSNIMHHIKQIFLQGETQFVIYENF